MTTNRPPGKREIQAGRYQGLMKFRAFVAADIRPDERLKDILSGLRRSGADLKVVRPELLHVTVKFLGDTEEDMIDRIASKIEEAVRGVQPFDVRLAGMGAFPSLSNIRVVWVGMEDSGVLAQTAQRLDESLEGLGFERDKRGFKPHLTVARARSPSRMGAVQSILKEKAASDFGTYRVGSIRLKKSVLGPQGPTYSDVKEIPLGR